MACVPHRLVPAFLWGFAWRACGASITVPCYVTRSHLSRLTVGQRVAPPVAPDNNNNKGGAYGGTYGGLKKEATLPSDIWFPWRGNWDCLLVSFASWRIRSDATPPADGLGTGLDRSFLITVARVAIIGVVDIFILTDSTSWPMIFSELRTLNWTQQTKKIQIN